VSVGELVSLNLGSPAVLAFVLGMLATWFRSDLRFPEPVTSLLSTYLLLAIGIKGGLRLNGTSLADLWAPAVLVIVLGLVVAIVTFAIAKGFLRLGVSDAASMAAHYGSVSAVTFTAAESFTRAAGVPSEAFLPALVALMEIPGIVAALVIASRLGSGTSMGRAVHEVLTGRSIVLLLGGVAIGAIANGESAVAIEPFFLGLFPGVLCLFLLDLGTLAGRRMPDIRAAGPRLVVMAVGLPVVFGITGTLVASAIGMSIGGATVIGAMTASASYIAAPAAVRAGLPDANVALSLGAALGVTFPFNLVIGIPLFHSIAERVA